ncbi:phytoene desaturase family protein [Amorphus sp. 3PC139-8]|uniref:phytoene desaturase family protein n=1 Tax=Amorphus sp. 3PC139-8 TaxID=2735676 RepID=UPI00345CFEFA
MTRPVDTVVIGGGLGGLMAAALLSKRGFSVALYERADHFGGAASTYRRAGLTIEASLHATEDPRSPGDPNRRALAELGILDDLPLVDVPELFEVRGGPVGAPFRLPHGFEAAREALGSRFPEVGTGAGRLLDEMAGVARALETAGSHKGPGGLLASLPRMASDMWPIVNGWNRSVSEVFARRLDGHEGAKFALAANLAYYDDNPAELWWPFFAVAQSGYLAHGGKYIRGGSQTLTDKLVDIIRANGGTAETGRSVTEVLLGADGRACGVVHTAPDGSERSEQPASAVLANAAPTVVTGMLPAEARARFVEAYRGRALSMSAFNIHFGLSRKPDQFGFSAYSTILLPEWMQTLDNIADCGPLLGEAPGAALPLLDIVDYSAIDAGHSAEPPHLVSVVGVDRVANWDGLEPDAYDERREAWLAAIEAEIDRQFPGFSAAVTTRMFASATTFARALNAPGGALYGFAPTPPGTPIWKGYPRSTETPIPGLLLASAYAGAGGFTGALSGGASAANRITRAKGAKK